MEADGGNAAAYSSLELNSGHRHTSHQQQHVVNTSSPSHELQRFRHHFEYQAGIRPSHSWLEQCLLHIRGSNRSSTGIDNIEEEIWNQILYADLRDVVRVPPPQHSSESNDDDGGNSTEAASTQLRHAIRQSSKNYANNRNTLNNNGKFQSHKVTLPSNFQLLVQIEEIVDVTMNGEQQLAAVGGDDGTNNAATSLTNNMYYNCRQSQQQQNTFGNTSSRNSKYRCLKMIISDGYHPNGKSSLSETNQHSEEGKENHTEIIMFARETSPILNLSISSPPGVKLVLHGPIDVRCGMLELNDGNCVVAGGEIESWKLIRMKAKERAQRERGLGVDPTIKALIWNPIMGDEEEVDEGEGESGDVQVAPAMAATIPTPPALSQAPSLPPTQPIITPNQPTNAHPNNISQSSSQQRYNHSQASSSSAGNISTHAASHHDSSGGGNLRQTTMDAFPKKPRPETTRLLPKNNIASRNNPSQLSNSSTGGRMNSHVSNLAPIFQQRQPPPPPSAMQINANNIISVDDSPPHSTTHTTSELPLQRQPVPFNPYTSLRQSSSTELVLTPSVVDPANISTNTTTTFTSNPSFSELKLILQSLRSNRALYEEYYGKIITVPCKMSDSSSSENLFNIVKSSQQDGGSDGSAKKSKKDKSKKEKKYEFLLVGKFIGPKQSDGAIAFRVDSSLVEPYFNGNTPALLRKLSREDKDRANRIVNQSTSQFVHDFSSLCQFQLKLTLRAEEFYAKMSSLSSRDDDWMTDVQNSLIVVINRGDQ